VFVEGDNLGALNLYGATAGAFTEESESVGLIFATHAAVALAGAQQEHHLSTALASTGHHRPSQRHRDGTLPHRQRPRLRPHARLSQEHNIKLHIIATQLIADATKPTAPRI